MAEHFRNRIKELRSRKVATEDAALGLQTAVGSAATAVASVTPLQLSSSALSSKTVASVPVANLPPPFVSPHAAVVKYRDTVRDPLCARFTTQHALGLFEVMLQSANNNARRKRARSPDDEASTEKTRRSGCPEPEPEHISEKREENGEKQDSPRHLDTGQPMLRKLCDVERKPENNPTSDSSLPNVVSYFLPEIAARCFTNNEELEKQDGPVNGQAHLNRPEASAGTYVGGSLRGNKSRCILVTGKRFPPCRSVNEYIPKARIAQGVYGVVISATKSTPEIFRHGPEAKQMIKKYALKQVKEQWLVDSQVGFPPYLLREFDLLLRIRHPNIVRAREVVILDKRLGAARHSRSETGGNGGGVEGSHKPRPETTEGFLHEVKGVASNTNAAAQPQEKSKTDGTPKHERGTTHVKDVYLVMDYCPYDLKSFLSLHNEKGVYLHLSSCNTHPDAPHNFLSRVKCIMQQLFRALNFLHDHRILHRDIKTSNILISHEGVVKLCDFGLGRLYCEGEQLTANVVTLMYRAPELHFGVRDYSHKMDVWSLGCIMAELFLKMPLFRAEEEVKHFAAICNIIGIPTEETFSGLYKMPELLRIMRCLTKYNRENHLAHVFEKSRHAGAATLPASGMDLLQRIFQWNPLDRLSARDALNHAFFHEAPLPCEPAELLRPIPTTTVLPVRHEGKSSTRRNETRDVVGTPPPEPLVVPSDAVPRAGEKPAAPPAMARVASVESTEATSTVRDASRRTGTVVEVASSSDDDAEHALLRELDSLKDVPSPGDGDEAQRVANQARLQANQDRDWASSPGF
ncbi:protein kinase [Trypanosoma rangeli SC58]|uniref:Protein kinase n=1 Tax=Trypanosoma rangeli SC58 TaxID=429131 RepID=A0A061J7R8_TRYRA|nr:protein kinase [Trypanosoma rangeli SC58]